MSRRYVFSVPIGPAHYKRLDQTLASLAAQPVDVGVAICHAGPQEDVAHLLAPYRDLIAYERHGPDTGQSDAINEGWRAVRGDVYGWLNADDALAPGALGHVDAMLDREPEADVVCGQSLIMDENERFTGLHPAVKAPDEDLFRSNIISQPSCFMKREALFEVGLLDQNLHYVMDWDLWVRLMAAGKRFAYTDSILSSVLWSRDTKTASISPARLREIRGVVARKGSPVTTAKTLYGFIVHHLSEYSILSAPTQRMRSFLRSGRAGALTYWGRPGADRADLQLFHYQPETLSGLRVTFTRKGDWCIEAAGRQAEAKNTQQVSVEIPLETATTLGVSIAGRKFQPSDIRSIAPIS